MHKRDGSGRRPDISPRSSLSFNPLLIRPSSFRSSNISTYSMSALCYFLGILLSLTSARGLPTASYISLYPLIILATPNCSRIVSLRVFSFRTLWQLTRETSHALLQISYFAYFSVSKFTTQTARQVLLLFLVLAAPPLAHLYKKSSSVHLIKII